MNLDDAILVARADVIKAQERLTWTQSRLRQLIAMRDAPTPVVPPVVASAQPERLWGSKQARPIVMALLTREWQTTTVLKSGRAAQPNTIYNTLRDLFALGAIEREEHKGAHRWRLKA